MPGESVISVEKEQITTTNVSNYNENKTEINVDSIKGRTCYFSLAGDLAIKAYESIKFSTFKQPSKKKKLKEEFRQRLNFAVLMFDHVVMHCSDPLRSEVVLEILEEKVQWIEQGRILFIFSGSIKNVKKDYTEYIKRKINEYQEGYFSEKEANSLNQEHITDEYTERVLNLLDKSPFFIRKSSNEEFSFDKLVLDDLNQDIHQEQVIVDSTSNLSQILSLSLSLHQLLYVMKYEVAEKNGICENVFPVKTSSKVIKDVKSHLRQGNTIARVAIVDFLKEELGKQELTDMQENVLEAISLRMDVLYCHMNSGKQMILEFHPTYEHRSIYQLDCFSSFIRIIAGSDKKIKITVDMINKILSDSKLKEFRLCYLASMADTHEHMNLTQHNFVQRPAKTVKLFNEILKNNIESTFANSFDMIKNVLNGDM